ncbi:MAG: cupin domain-containing protein [Burkholderiales bacterium]
MSSTDPSPSMEPAVDDPRAARSAALADLLGSAAGVGSFFDRYWERAPLHIRDPRWPSGLLRPDLIDDLVSFRRHDTDVVLARTAFDDDAERATYTSRHSTDADEISHAWHDGSTIVITALHQRDPRVALYVQRLEAAFQHPVGANLYFTPATNQGFRTHVDDHDVFVLQLAGRKHWTIFDADAMALRRHDADRDVLPLRLALEQGEALYIPRGYPHFAATNGEASTHLTVGLYPFQWCELVARSVREVARDRPELRLSLSPAAGVPDVDALPPDARAAVFSAPYVARAYADLRRSFLRRARPFVAGRFARRSADIELDTPLASRYHGLTLVEVDGERATIRFPGNYVTGPSVLAPALRFVADRVRFTPAELPGGLTGRTQVVLARRLAREGLLAIDEEETEHE